MLQRGNAIRRSYIPKAIGLVTAGIAFTHILSQEDGSFVSASLLASVAGVLVSEGLQSVYTNYQLFSLIGLRHQAARLLARTIDEDVPVREGRYEV